MVHDCLFKGLGLSSRVWAIRHIKDSVPLIKSQANKASMRVHPVQCNALFEIMSCIKYNWDISSIVVMTTICLVNLIMFDALVTFI